MLSGNLLASLLLAFAWAPQLPTTTMTERKRNGSIDWTSSSSPHNKHEDAAISDDAPGTIEAKERGPDPLDESQDLEYLSGLRLVLILGGVTLAAFLILLDASIVATVSLAVTDYYMSSLGRLLTGDRRFPRSPATSIP